MVAIYDIDLNGGAIFPKGEDPRSLQVQQMVAKRARSWFKHQEPPEFNTFKVSVADLLFYGTRLGHRDVLHNMGDPHLCEECGKRFQNVNDLKECDGSFPMNCGQSFPVNAYGKQLHCRRGRICNPLTGRGGCFKKGPREAGPTLPLGTKISHWKKIKQPRTKNTFFFVCTACALLSDDHLDVWGENVRAPGIDSAPNAIAPTDVPFLPLCDLYPPHEEFRRTEASRAALLCSTIASIGRRGGELAVEAAASFMRLVRKVCLRSEHQHQLLAYIDDEHKAAELRYQAQFPEGSFIPSFGKNLLPIEVSALKKAASPTMITPSEIPYHRFRISIHNLKLRESVVDVFCAHVAPLLQSMFLDPRFNHKQFFCQSKELRRAYVHAETGMRYWGHEMIHGNQWFKLEKTIPPGGSLVCVTISMDQTKSQKGKQCPYQLSVNNFPASDARKRYGTQIFGMGSILPVNMKRRTEETVSENDHQHAAKADAFIASACCSMLPLEELAKKEQTFFIRSLQRTITVSIRCSSLAADYEETKMQAQVVGGFLCARCNGPQWARNKESSEGTTARRDQRHLMRYEKECICNTAEQRTPAYVVRNQAAILQEVRFGTKTEAHKMTQATGVNPHVEQKLHRLRHLFPHVTGSVYSATGCDLLHASMLGVEMKFCSMVDALIGALCRKDLDNFTKLDDARDRQDARLSYFPSFFSLRLFARTCSYHFIIIVIFCRL